MLGANDRSKELVGFRQEVEGQLARLGDEVEEEVLQTAAEVLVGRDEIHRAQSTSGQDSVSEGLRSIGTDLPEGTVLGTPVLGSLTPQAS